MQNHHKINEDLHPGVGYEGDEARERFESNRRYDQRPATQNSGRLNLVLTTRGRRKPQNRFANAGPWTLGLGLLVGLTIGIIIGLRIWSNDGAPTDSESNARALDSQVLSSVPGSASAGDQEQEQDATETGLSEAQAEAPAPATPLAVQPDFLASLQTLELDKLDFIPGRTELTSSGQAVLQDLAETLTAHPQEPVELRVRTYSEVSPGRNHGLSVKQATALSSALTAEGVEPDRMTVVGLGSGDIAQPSAAAALFLESSNPQFRRNIESLEPLVLDAPFAETLSPAVIKRLTSASTAIGDSPLLLVGYAWSESTEDENHQVSHDLLDSAVAMLTRMGVDADQISTIGMGSVAVPLDGRRSIVSIEAGETAAIAVSLGGIPLDAVSFEPGTTTLTSPGTTTLTTVAETLLALPDVRVEVAVHSYDAATNQDNHDRSKLKAEAIGRFLTNAGVPPDQVLLMGHGDPGHFAAPGRDSAVTFTVIR